MKFGLSEDQLKQIRDILSKYPEITEALIFGSRAMGNYKEASDVDIALNGGVNASLAEKLKAELEEKTHLPFFFDVIAYPSIDNPKLAEHIDNYGIPVHRIGWTETKLDDLVEVIHGYAFSGKFFSDEPTENILVTPGNFKIGGGFKFEKMKYYSGEVPEKYVLHKGDVIVTMTDLSKEADTLGYSAVVPNVPEKKLLHNQRIGLLKTKSKIGDLNFINWLMRSEEYRWHVIGTASGSTVHHTSPARILDYKFLLPSLPEQRAIAGVLSSLDDKIDLLHRQNKTLEGMAAALWRKVFIDEADPRGTYGRLKDIAELNPSRPLQKGALATYLDMGNMPTMGPFPLDWVTREYRGGMRFKNGDTIIARITPCLENGKTAFVNFLGQNEIGWGSTEYIVVAPKNDVCPEWLYFLARNNDFREFAIQNMTGTSGRQRVSWDAIAQYELPLPSKRSMEKFGSFAASVMERIRMNCLHMRTLSRQRDTLLPKLISGEVAVKA